MNKVGIYAAYWLKDWKADIPYFIRKASALGFDVLEVPAAQLTNVDAEECKVLRDAAEESGIELTYCIGFPQNKDLSSENIIFRRDGIEYARSVLKTMKQIGGRIFCGINYASWPSSMNEADFDKRPYLERSIACVKEIIKTAEDYDILYCIEVVNRFEHFLINTTAEGLSYIEEVGSPNIKLLLDTFHMNIEEDSLEEAILAAGDKLGHFHAGESNRKPPGMGRQPWLGIFKSLRQIGYQGRVVMEPFVKTGGEIGRDIKVWHELFNDNSESSMDKEAKRALAFIRSMLS